MKINRLDRRTSILLTTGIILCFFYLLMCHITGRTPETKIYRCFFKFCINACWICIAYINSREGHGQLKKKILISLVFYSIGDILAPANYLIGGIGYFIGHIFITFGYIKQYGMSKKQILFSAIASTTLIIILILTLGFEIRVPFIAIYILLLTTLFVSSFGNKYFFSIVTIFLLSDVLAYVRKMFFNYNWLYDITLSLYYIAIIMYCLSFSIIEE